MTVYWVQLMVRKNNQSTSFKVLLESDLGSVDQMVEQLERKGIVRGRRLKVVRDKGGDFIITEREGFAFGVAGLVSIQPYDRVLREAVGEAERA